MSKNKDSELSIPSADECEKRCQEFAAFTNTDTAFALYALQRRGWDLNRATTDFFDGVEFSNSSSSSDDDVVAIPWPIKMSLIKEASNTVQKIKFITWNIDGLDKRSLPARIENVTKILNCELPDVVHLQELVPTTFPELEKLLPDYKVIAGGNPSEDEYFTATLLRRATVSCDFHEIIPFETSVMGRNMLVVKIKVNNTNMMFINTHLESTKPYEKERVKQLKSVFMKILAEDADQTVLFAGDLNIRDKELNSVGGIPAGLEDLWITCGSRPECIYTWDPVRNTNLEMAYPHRARFRFDRVYLRRGNRSSLMPKHFGLIGLEKIRSCGRFPSDHWGVVCIFEN
ncbi:hypothetical protein CHUAL_002473 [Chamberlinius hualienensis]